MQKLNLNQINEALNDLPGWTFTNDTIHKNLSFDTYMDGIDFVSQLAVKAEEHNHHPDLTVGWCKVGVTFTTHDSGGVTAKDIAMAKEVERLLS